MKNKSILITKNPASYTIYNTAVVTVHLINQSPGAESVGGVTLYFEPMALPMIELILTNNVDQSYGNAVAQGIKQGLGHLTSQITGLRIWWCDWLGHPTDSRPKAFAQAAKRAIAEISPWLELTDFTPSKTTTAPPNNAFEQSLSTGLKSPSNSRWTMQTPLISHITRISSAHVLSKQHPPQRTGKQTITQTILAFKSIASTQRVCPIDKTPNFQTENREIFNAFADTIRRDLPNARGFDIIVHELHHHTDDPTNRQKQCLRMLISALQQAIYVGSKQCY